MKHKMIYMHILEHINTIPVIDTHEHLESEDARLNRHVDMFNTYLIHYASSDLVSSGMKDDEYAFLLSDSSNLQKKWYIFKPYWERARNTSYCKSLILATKGIYGADDINDDTYLLIDTKIKELNKKGLYRHVLKDLCNIEISILDSNMYCDKEFFRSTFRADHFIKFEPGADVIKDVEEKKNISITELSDLVKYINHSMEEHKRVHGVVCVKTGLAYERILKYDKTTLFAAQKIFDSLMALRQKHGKNFVSYIKFDTKPMEDYLMHALVQSAGDHHLPIQIHTGLQEGNGNYITNSNPTHLINLFMEYPDVRFDLFHGGYPYGGEMCAIAKNFRNVFVDLCWTHIISREFTVRFIEELIDTVPMNKIFGFGGDYCFVEGIYGHLQMARENIALALANKVNKGYITLNDAMHIAKRMLYDNAKEFFKL